MNNLTIRPIKSNNVTFKGNSVPIRDNSLTSSIKRSVNLLHDRAEREVAEYDYFKPVKVAFENPDGNLYAGTVKLKISQPSKDACDRYKTIRELEVIVDSPTKCQNLSRVLAQGTKKEILEILKDNQLTGKLEEFVKESSTMFIAS